MKAVKKSEHATEGEGVVLACKSESFPPITEWVWYKVSDTEQQILTNNSQNKVYVVSVETRTELHILNLDLETDPGKYVCNGSSVEGTDQAVIVLHVRSQLAALWPFLGIVAEVLVLVTIIFIYEKRRKPDEVLDGELAPSPWLPVCAVQERGTEEGAVGGGPSSPDPAPPSTAGGPPLARPHSAAQ